MGRNSFGRLLTILIGVIVMLTVAFKIVGGNESKKKSGEVDYLASVMERVDTNRRQLAQVTQAMELQEPEINNSCSLIPPKHKIYNASNIWWILFFSTFGFAWVCLKPILSRPKK
ncbi:hypothetical protein KKA47_02255 [bacterium]|nr:hypothetical protein [bacterium]